MRRNDPVEAIVRAALSKRGIVFTEEELNEHRLDFHLPDMATAIECKQFYTDRITDQLQRFPNVIVIQGLQAARAFHQLVTGEKP